MRPPSSSSWKPRVVYFIAGLSLAGSCLLVGLHWIDIVWAFQEPNIAHDRQPPWFHAVDHILGWLPWAVLAAILVLRCVKGRRIRFGSYLLGTISPWVLAIGELLVGDNMADWLHRRAFDAEAWRSQESVEYDEMWPPRLCMVDDLMASGRLDGLTRNQVLKLLGPPEDKGFPGQAADYDIHYYLGPERGFLRIDSEWLFISLGDDGKVNRYWLGRD